MHGTGCDRDLRADEFSVPIRGFDVAKSGAKTGVASRIALAIAQLRFLNAGSVIECAGACSGSNLPSDVYCQRGRAANSPTWPCRYTRKPSRLSWTLLQSPKGCTSSSARPLKETAVPTVPLKNKSFTLTAEDKTQLEKIAPWFDIDFRKLDAKTYVLRVAAGTVPQLVELPATTAHRRLLAEICGLSSKWVHFHFAVSCRDSLLGRSDASLIRLSELYTRDRGASLLHDVNCRAQ